MYAQATLYDYWMALYSRRGVILLVALSAMGFTLAISYKLPPIYEAKATLYFPINDISSAYTSLSTQRIAQPPLRPNPDDKEAGIHTGVLKSDDMVDKIHARFPQKTPAFFKKNVDFSTSPQFFTDIFVRDRDAALAAEIANAYVDLYAEFHRDLLRKRAERTVLALEPELVRIQQRIAEKTEEISDFKRKNKLLSSADAEQIVVSQTQQLERDRNEVLVELKAIQERLSGIDRREPPAGGQSGGRPVITNPMIDKERRLLARRDALTERIATLRNRAPGTVTAVATMQKLESEKRVLDQLRDSIELNLAEARMQSATPVAEIVRVQKAHVPQSPSFPIPVLNAFVALVLGFAAACYVALLLSYLDRLRIERVRRNLIEDGMLREIP